ncbi:hypothetical protein AgCh_011972 [Apium graveolens]
MALHEKVQGRDRSHVKFVAEQLGLDGSYVSCTYIEQIQLKKLVNDVMALPDDLRTKLSIDDDITNPKEALSRACAEQRSRYLNRFSIPSYVPWKLMLFRRAYTTWNCRWYVNLVFRSTVCRSLSLSSQGCKNPSKPTKPAVSTRRFDESSPESPAALPKQGVITQLVEQITKRTKRMDECTSGAGEINSKLTTSNAFSRKQILAVQAASYNDTAPPEMFMAGNGFMSGTLIPNSLSRQSLECLYDL